MGEEIHVGQFITQYPYPDQFDEEFDYFCAGAAKVAEEVAERTSQRTDIEVSVFTSSGALQYEHETQNGVSVHRTPSLTQLNTTQLSPPLLSHPLSYDLDVVHAHNSTPPGMLAAYLYATVHDVPFVITHHGGENYEPHGGLVRRGGLALYTNVLIETIFERADRVAIPSKGYLEESAILSDLDTKVVAVPNGVDRSAYETDKTQQELKRELGVDPETQLILYLSALHPRKGSDILLDAYLGLPESLREESKLVIAGDGALADELAATVRAHDASVDLPGFVSEQRKQEYMEAADLFVLPSKTAAAEMFPLVILEAAAADTPVITSAFPTLEWIIDRYEAGVVTEPNDSDALQDRLTELLTDAEYRETLAANATAMAQTLHWDKIADAYGELFHRLDGSAETEE